MKTQKQLSSMLIKLSGTASNLGKDQQRALNKDQFTKADNIGLKIRENYRKIKMYASQVTEQGFEENTIIGETLCCDWEEFENCYKK